MATFYPPTGLTTIQAAANQSLSYKPILLVDIVFTDGTTVARFATENITFGGHTYTACITRNTLDTVQRMSSTGIDSFPGCSIEIADPKGDVFNTYELNGNGFKGAAVTLTLVTMNKMVNGQVSSDSRVKFVGRADPPNLDDKGIRFTVRSRLDLSRTFVPTTPISKLCPFLFPSTAAERALATIQGNPFWRCGYMDGGGNNDPSTGLPYTNCNNDITSCVERGMFSIGRYGGVDYEPPTVWQNPHIYVSAQKGSGWNTDNQAKYGQYVPMIYGAGMVKGIVANVLGTGNDVHFEVIVQDLDGTTEFGYGGPFTVIVNNVVVPHNSRDTIFPDPFNRVDNNFFWEYVNNGKRNGTPNHKPPYNVSGIPDPYGSMVVLHIVVPTTVHGSSNSVPDVLIFTWGKKVRVYDSLTTWVNQGTTDVAGYTGLDYTVGRPVCTVMDLLKTAAGYDYSDFDIQSVLDAEAFCRTAIPYTTIAGPYYCKVNVASDGITVTRVSGGLFTYVLEGNLGMVLPSGGSLGLVQIDGIVCVLDEGISPNPSTDGQTLKLRYPGTGGAKSNVPLLISHPRYKMNIALQQRTALSELLTSLKLGCNLNLVQNNDTNKFQFFVDAGLADQQSSPVAGSNDNTPYASYRATADTGFYNGTTIGGGIQDGRLGVGYVAYHFHEGNILTEGPDDNPVTTVHISQTPSTNTPNRITTPFQNEEQICESDTSTRVDTDDYARMKQTYDAQVRMEGVPNFDQLFRRANNYMARQYRGNPRSSVTYGDTGGTINLTFKVPGIKVSHLRLGHIVAVSLNKFGWDTYPYTPGGGELFRITGITVDSNNFDIVMLSMAWHDDRWYLDSFGNGPQPQYATTANTKIDRLPYAWKPYGGTQPNISYVLGTYASHDPIYSDLNTWVPGIRVVYTTNTDGTVQAKVAMYGCLPVNTPSPVLTTPYLAYQGTANVSSGTVPAGSYYVAVVGIDANNLVSMPQIPQHMCQIFLASTGSLIVPQIKWSSNTVSGAFFVGTDPNNTQFQGYITGTPLPDHVTISALKGSAGQANNYIPVTSNTENAFPIPDVKFDHVELQIKRVRHAGPVGTPFRVVNIGSHNSWAIDGAGFSTNQWTGYNVGVIGLVNSQGYIPLINAPVSGNTADRLTVPVANGLYGIADNSALIIYSKSVMTTNSSGNLVLTDPNWVNSLGPRSLQNDIGDCSASGTNPSLLYTLTPHGYTTGDSVTVRSVLGCTSVNGTWTVDVVDDYHYTVPVTSGPDDYAGGGVSYIATGLAEGAESGKVIRFINPDGTSYTYNIANNDGTSITTNGPVSPMPANGAPFIIEEPQWVTIGVSDSLKLQDPLLTTVIEADISNSEDQTILVRALMCDQNGKECNNNQSPFRMIWVFGQEGIANGLQFQVSS